MSIRHVILLRRTRISLRLLCLGQSTLGWRVETELGTLSVHQVLLLLGGHGSVEAAGTQCRWSARLVICDLAIDLVGLQDWSLLTWVLVRGVLLCVVLVEGFERFGWAWKDAIGGIVICVRLRRALCKN
jgi:hypothetical protein